MSFRFSVGEFITAIQLANKIRREFDDSPSQFKAVKDEVRTLSHVLQDVDITVSNRELDNEQKRKLDEIDEGCRNVLDELQRILDKNVGVESDGGDVGKRMKKVRRTVLDWLTPIDFATQQSDLISRRQAGTGIPGAGKTILTSIVVDYLSSNFQKDARVGIAYLYCNLRRKDEQKAEQLLASLLKQLTQGLSPLPDDVNLLYDRHKDKRTRQTSNEIFNILQSVGGPFLKVFIVIDALDECEASDGNRANLLEQIFAFQMKCRVNIFTTSRSIPDITERFNENLCLEIRASNHDVRKYLDGHMAQLNRCVRDSLGLQDEIKTSIVKSVDGMFLLAQLQFDSLKGKASPKAIRTALKKLSTGYDQAYDDAMTRIEGQLADEEHRAKQVLSWITCARRPLTTSELEHAFATELRESQFDDDNITPIEDMVSVCAGLVTADEESHIVQCNITSICVTYHSFNVFASGICQSDHDFEGRLRSNHFYDYSSHNWRDHARKASSLIPEVISFLDAKAQVEESSQALLALKLYSFDFDYSQRIAKQVTGLHLAAYFGLRNIVNRLFEIGLVAHIKDYNGRTPPWWAARNG
ncbi:hypothetical protein BJ878DRAFT_549809 [Calycina marina]|uniref:NACHT domain-containing protein n=1 Tax=Calycina marina TaxID=1763456 RepID=A0A9P7Z3Y0_9HELO|nr:hypothetical protein BJ878DRAFT_549809 [Calycina marina]